jgi:hypothetical protein
MCVKKNVKFRLIDSCFYQTGRIIAIDYEEK